MPLPVAIIEDNASYRESLCSLLGGAPDFKLVFAAASAEEALRQSPLACSAVLVVDLELPGASGIELIRRLKNARTDLQFLVLTNFENSERIFGAIQAGASGYLLKRSSFAQIVEAIAEVHAGGAPMTPHIARRVLESMHDPAPVEPLSPREQEILRLAREGRTYRQISAHLGITYDTVRTYFNRIYQKLHVHSRSEAVRRFGAG